MKSKSKLLNNEQFFYPQILLSPILSIFIGSIFIAILAQVSIPIPFSPVPITGQTIGIVIIGTVLGPLNGSMAVIVYIFEGALGLPVFANLSSGIHVLMGPTAGYIWGFIVGAFLMGVLDKIGFTSSFLLSFLSCLIVTTLILVIGTLYLAFFKTGLKLALEMGFYPFLIGDFVKSFISASIILGLKRIR